MQSRFGDKLLKFSAVFPQDETAVLEGLKERSFRLVTGDALCVKSGARFALRGNISDGWGFEGFSTVELHPIFLPRAAIFMTHGA